MKGYKAGAGRSVITPDHSVELCGYGDFLGRVSNGVHDSLYSTAVTLECEDETVAIISADLVGLMAPEVEKIRNRVRYYTSIPKENIIVACTNTHQGPATVRFRAIGEMSPEYMEKLPDLISEAAIESYNYVLPADIKANRGEIEGVSFNRETRNLDKDEMFILFSEPFTLVNLSCKPVVLERDNRSFSRDYPGAIADILEESGYGKTLFTNGAAGDRDPIKNYTRKYPGRKPAPFKSDYEDLDFYGKTIGRKVSEMIPSARGSSPNIAVISKKIELPLDKNKRKPGEHCLDHSRDKMAFYQSWRKELDEFISSGKAFPDSIEAEIQAIRIGDEILVGLPGEIYTSTRNKIREKHPKSTVIGFANGSVGYIPPREQIQNYAIHGYKLYGLFPFAPEAEEVLRDKVSSIIDDINLK